MKIKCVALAVPLQKYTNEWYLNYGLGGKMALYIVLMLCFKHNGKDMHHWDGLQDLSRI